MKYVFALIAFLFVLVFPSNISAQTYECNFSGGQCRPIDNCGAGYAREDDVCTPLGSDVNACSNVSAPCQPLISYGGNGELCREGNTCDAGNRCVTVSGYCTDGNNGSFCLNHADCDSNFCGPGGLCASSGTPPPAGSTPTPGGGGGGGAPGPVTPTANLLCRGGNGISTAIGCIPFSDTNELLSFFLGWAAGIGGGISFVLSVFAGFQIMTSAGDPKKLQAGKELLTSSLSGLILIIFSVFIVRLLGVDILGFIPR